MGKARVLGQYRPFVPNRYADIRRRLETTANRQGRLERQREELEIAKMEKVLDYMKIQMDNSGIYIENEIQYAKDLEKLLKYLEELENE